jgi:hypothetical protein
MVASIGKGGVANVPILAFRLLRMGLPLGGIGEV